MADSNLPSSFIFPLRPEVGPADAAPATCGGCFATAAGALAFLGAAAEARLADYAVCRHGPTGEWWAEMAASWSPAAPLIHAAGGHPYVRAGAGWRQAPLADAPVAAGSPAAPALWPAVTPAALLTATPLQPRRPPPAAALEVIVPGALGRWVLKRALALALKVGVTAALRRPLQQENPSDGVLLLRLQARQGVIPPSLARALASLPYTLLAQAAVFSSGRLLIDHRYRLPLAETLLESLIPAAEIWTLGGPDTGHARLQLLGEESDGADLLTTSLPPATPVPAGGPAPLPAPLPVRLVANRHVFPATDAVLLDDAELRWLRAFLLARPAAEGAFLLPGAGRHLLLVPGGLAEALPFGVPLVRLGPGGLYLEAGYAFHPPLPEGARVRLFGLTEERVVAVAADNAYGFDSRRLLPAWTLWVGAAPPVREGLPPASRRLLERVAESVRLAEVDHSPAVAAPRRAAGSPGARPRLLEEAQRAELAGDLARAAELLEAAGELAGAGRLYERAAQGLR